MTTLHKFPLRENKAPAVPKGTSWRDWTGAVTTPLFGIMVPHGAFIIDIDYYKGVTREDVERAIGCRLDWDAAGLQDTLNGGRHYAFGVPHGAVLHQGQDIGGLVGFDTRATGDGYIATGEGYTVLAPMGIDWTLLNPHLLPQLPAAAVEFFSRSHSKVQTVSNEALAPIARDFGTFLNAQPIGLSGDQIEQHLALLSDEDSTNGDTWLRVGMAIYHETGGSDDGWILFDEFSQRTTDQTKYDQAANYQRWQSFGNRNDKLPITFASVMQMVRVEQSLPALDEVGEEAYELARKIEFTLYKMFEGLELPNIGQVTHASVFEVCPRRIHAIITGCYWQPVGAKGIWLLNDSEHLNFHGEKSAHEFIAVKFGKVMNASVVELAARIAHEANPLLASTVERYIREALAVAPAAIMQHLEYANQRTSVAYSVDMFADRSQMQLEENAVRIIYQHKELQARVEAANRPDIIADYIEHFPRFHALLDFIVAARFAADRKKAYLWIHADSDWGKGFLMSVFDDSNLGISVDLSMSEIEKMFEGAPVGRAPHEFKRSMVLNFNEVKGIKRELKEIESTLRLAPKHQMTSRVDVYAKLLWSADSIGSLVSEEGVEDQLANRISAFKEIGRGGIAQRALYIEVGGRAYHAVIAHHTAQYMNAQIEQYRLLGADGASKRAQQFLDAFHDCYGIGKLYGLTSEALPAMADNILADIAGMPFQDKFAAGIVEHPPMSGAFYLGAPRRFVSEWIRNRYSRSELGTLASRMPELVSLISADGEGVAVSTWVDGKNRKLLKLR